MNEDESNASLTTAIRPYEKNEQCCPIHTKTAPPHKVRVPDLKHIAKLNSKPRIKPDGTQNAACSSQTQSFGL